MDLNADQNKGRYTDGRTSRGRLAYHNALMISFREKNNIII